MINLWDYANDRHKVQIMLKGETIIQGKTVCIWEAEEFEEENEDAIGLGLDSGVATNTYQSEITKIDCD